MGKENKSIYIILGTLSFGAKSGYDIKKYIESSVSNFWNISYGQIYPTLNNLVGGGYVTYLTERDEGRPEKKVYSITDKGMTKLKEWLMTPINRTDLNGDELLLRLFFGMYISKKDNISQLSQYQKQQVKFLQKLNDIREELEQYKAYDNNLEYAIITVRQGQIIVKSQLEWCEEAIERIKNIK